MGGNTGELSTLGDFDLCLLQQRKQQEQMMAMMMKGVPPVSAYHQPSSTGGLVRSADACHQLAWILENQKRELDRLVQKQNESLLLALQQQRRRHLGSLMKVVETKASVLLRQKQEEVERANRRTAELMNDLQRTQVENETWQRIAKEREAAFLDLSNNLELVRQQNYYNGTHPPRQRDDETTSPASSSSGSCSLPTTGGMMCRGCNSHEPNVLFFPCRHLCFCTACAGLFDSCPLCGCVKKCCIEVLVS